MRQTQSNGTTKIPQRSNQQKQELRAKARSYSTRVRIHSNCLTRIPQQQPHTQKRKTMKSVHNLMSMIQIRFNKLKMDKYNHDNDDWYSSKSFVTSKNEIIKITNRKVFNLSSTKYKIILNFMPKSKTLVASYGFLQGCVIV